MIMTNASRLFWGSLIGIAAAAVAATAGLALAPVLAVGLFVAALAAILANNNHGFIRHRHHLPHHRAHHRPLFHGWFHHWLRTAPRTTHGPHPRGRVVHGHGRPQQTTHTPHRSFLPGFSRSTHNQGSAGHTARVPHGSPRPRPGVIRGHR